MIQAIVEDSLGDRHKVCGWPWYQKYKLPTQKSEAVLPCRGVMWFDADGIPLFSFMGERNAFAAPVGSFHLVG